MAAACPDPAAAAGVSPRCRTRVLHAGRGAVTVAQHSGAEVVKPIGVAVVDAGKRHPVAGRGCPCEFRVASRRPHDVPIRYCGHDIVPNLGSSDCSRFGLRIASLWTKHRVDDDGRLRSQREVRDERRQFRLRRLWVLRLRRLELAWLQIRGLRRFRLFEIRIVQDRRFRRFGVRILGVLLPCLFRQRRVVRNRDVDDNGGVALRRRGRCGDIGRGRLDTRRRTDSGRSCTLLGHNGFRSGRGGAWADDDGVLGSRSRCHDRGL
jgi:hypothetical protein